MRPDPFFSIVTITLNNLAGLRATRASVEEQSLAEYEWVVIDGASSDGTVEEMAGWTIAGFSSQSEKDGGIYSAMNKGLARSRGEYVIFLNSSDRLAGPQVLASLKRSILAAGARPELVYGHALEDGGAGRMRLKKARPIHWLHYGMPTHHQAMVYARAALDDLRYDESFRVSADYDLTCRLYARRGTTLLVDLPVCIFRHGGISEQRAHVGRAENGRVQREVLGQGRLRRTLTRAGYLSSYLLRKEARPLYDRLRSRPFNPPC